MFGLMLLVAQLAPPAPPPIVTTATVPPPIVRFSANRTPVTVQVRASAGSRLLLADRFLVGPMNASFSQQRNEGAPARCTEFRDGSRRTSMNFSLGHAYSVLKDQYRVTLSWSRPGGDDCGAGQRTTSVEQTVTLQPGKTVIVQGDGGLQVELTRE